MRIILGIDPGSVVTGYGVIQAEGNHYQFLDCGAIKTQGDNFATRLFQIYHQLIEVLQRYKPHEVSIEDIFFHNNAKSALKLGQARGAAIVAVASQGLMVSEYSAREVKQAVVGYGAAGKDQVQHMVKRLLNLKQTLQSDAADALAIAICHGQNRLLNNVYKELLKETS
ncbi:MAG: crossover junction endodeoxyribonuclease RuvC [Legionellales bacterium]|nr:crossover junction endodeoxyribonuclease RuvC [Legionellales bacterium]